ncbi:MAG: D-alanine--D-alanine ligase [Armatimonadota bacterium]|nr:D-alanine--D-alanine ligase [Armatimonadota bacterium]MDR7485908.1 D-alanine--D-alanine ligase [Armatimonadota bacterium]MDR7533141.1 D-alanine--D-alanine ligase [Armatimonadota bacterium]MDR7536613.1 D-alanine--D-alanine ligase [Armatimonadota bacterium]
MSRLRVGVLMGGRSPEREVSLRTGACVLEALDRTRYEAVPAEIPRAGSWMPPEGLDVAFVALHGPYGEDGTIQGLLEFAGIPYTGSGVLASALAMDKRRARHLMAFHGVPVPASLAVERDAASLREGLLLREIEQALGFPCVVKPNAQGSSIGVAIVRTPAELPRALDAAFALDNLVLVEEYLTGVEATCGILDDPDVGGPVALPLVEIVPAREFFDYEAKYTPGAAEEICPARLPPAAVWRAQAAALKAYRALGCADFGRVDLFVREADVVVLEVNTIPGLTRESLLPKAARAAGIEFPRLVERVIASALRRAGRPAEGARIA